MKKLLLGICLFFLPVTVLAQEKGLINVSVADMKLSPDYESPTDSQALLGTPVLILGRDGRWSLVRTPDGYRGWVPDMQVTPLDSAGAESWKRADRVIVTGYYTLVRSFASGNAPVVSDAVMGDIFELAGGDAGQHRSRSGRTGWQNVRFPDGREGYIPSDAVTPFREWAASRRATPESITSAAKGFLGFPYLWGGLSVKGFDCSGLVKHTYFMNGVILLRNASQQMNIGEEIPLGSSPLELAAGMEPADLIMFAKPTPENPDPRASHVGIYLGGNLFIHSSLIVRINSILPDRADFYDSKQIIAVRRIIGREGGPGITRIISHPWYF